MDVKKSKQKNCTFSITEGDDPRIEAFWSKQSNKSGVMKYLITSFLDKKGIKDPKDIIDFNVQTNYSVSNKQKNESFLRIYFFCLNTEYFILLIAYSIIILRKARYYLSGQAIQIKLKQVGFN